MRMFRPKVFLLVSTYLLKVDKSSMFSSVSHFEVWLLASSITQGNITNPNVLATSKVEITKKCFAI